MSTLGFHSPLVDGNYALARLYYISEIIKSYYIFGVRRLQFD